MIDEVTPATIGRRRFRARLARLVPLVLALALVSSACGSGGAAGSVGQTTKVIELQSISELQDRFNEDSGAVRLILLMSPT